MASRSGGAGAQNVGAEDAPDERQPRHAGNDRHEYVVVAQQAPR